MNQQNGATFCEAKLPLSPQCVTAFGSRENLFTWEADEEWEVVLDNVIEIIKEYLEKGKYANTLKGLTAVGTGFVDGDIEILFRK